jgi:capsular polysaccharide biosynthesis protein
MSAPNQTSPARSDHRRRWWTGLGVTVVVLAVALVVLVLLPRSATATASLTVTPRTEAGADAALLLADRYTALAGSAETLRAAREADPALAGVSVDELIEGTEVERAEGTATITVRVTLPEREAAATAANAIVDALVETGADEDLVDVDSGAEATPSRTTTSPDRLRWSVVARLLSLACGLAAAALAGRSTRPRPTGGPLAPPMLPPGGDDTPADAPAEVLDDLPGFLENPPGSVPALPATAPVAVSAPVDPPRDEATAADAGGPDGNRSPVVASRRSAAIATGAAVVLLVAGAALVRVTADRWPARCVPAARPPRSPPPRSRRCRGWTRPCPPRRPRRRRPTPPRPRSPSSRCRSARTEWRPA